MAIVGKGWQAGELRSQQPAEEEEGADVEVVYREYHDALKRFMTRMLNSSEEADDLVQEVYLRAIRSTDRRTKIAFPQAFLFKTARNLVRDQFRRRQTRHVKQHVSIDSVEVVSDDLSPEENLASKQMLRRLKETLLQLEPKQRQALLLHRMDRLTHEEIASLMGVSISTVRRYIEQSLLQCRKNLQDE